MSMKLISKIICLVLLISTQCKRRAKVLNFEIWLKNNCVKSEIDLILYGENGAPLPDQRKYSKFKGNSPCKISPRNNNENNCNNSGDGKRCIWGKVSNSDVPECHSACKWCAYFINKLDASYMMRERVDNTDTGWSMVSYTRQGFAINRTCKEMIEDGLQ
jgi:hypothetical protein